MLGRLIQEMRAEDQVTPQEKKKPLLKLMTVRDAAEVINCSHHQIYRYISSGMFDGCLVKLGDLKTIRFHPGKFARLIEEGGFTPSPNKSI